MSNPKKELDLITSKIEELACHDNPGPTAVKAAAFIDETYLLIPKETLPAVTYGTIDDAFSSPRARILSANGLVSLTDQVLNGDTSRMRTMGLQYLAMAEHIESKRVSAEAAKLKKERYNAYLTIFPDSNMIFEDFDYDGTLIPSSSRRAITRILELEAQLAESKKKS